MQLTLVRHGEAHPAQHEPDEKRALTERGHTQAQETAEAIHTWIQPEVFVVSPLVRAQQTLAYLQTYFPNVPVVVCDAIKPEDDAKVAIEWLSHLPYESIAVVCHMNVVAYMEQILVQQPFHAFQLAEARVYEQAVIEAGLSNRTQQFIPQA